MSRFIQAIAIILLFNFTLENLCALHPFLDEISCEIEDTNEKEKEEDLEEKQRHKLVGSDSFFDLELVILSKKSFPEFIHSFFYKKPALEILIPPPKLM